MADEHAPNDASRKSKAEGERQSGTDEQAGGITNRPLGEEIESQEAVPERGDSQAGADTGTETGKKSKPARDER